MTVTASPPMITGGVPCGRILDLDGDHRFLGMEIPPRQLVLRGDSHHLIDAGERFKCFLQRGWQGSADDANDGSLFPFRKMGAEPETANPLNDIVDLFTTRAGRHDDDHESSSNELGATRNRISGRERRMRRTLW